MYPPDGGGRIRFYERIRPLVSFSQIVRMVLRNDPAFRVKMLLAPCEVITCEGEYGAWVRVQGTREGVAAVHFVGAVFADEFAAALDTLVVLKDKAEMLEATAKEMLANVSFGLGVRRRRYLYCPPAGWQAIPNGLVANWYPPDFPANHSNIVVYPAQPMLDAGHHTFAYFLSQEEAQGFTLHGEGGVDIVSEGGLEGKHWQFTGRRANRDDLVHREVITFLSPTYSYALRMESFDTTRLPETREIFRQTARTIQPIPSPGRRQVGGADSEQATFVFSHWSD